ncbi:MAG: PAS domain-containing protein [Prevotella sp.]|nr:PAS domain-containing protein [Bacteroides sp.]MCM1366557.1 PAS domain-containing protein [Prevotella sp.]MCM1436867.1 PAS domain-containing protein [Prevotella sp.]
MEDLKNWADNIECAVTICDKNCKILYMNEKSRQTFARHGDIIGHDLLQYHPVHAQEKIRHMLSTGDTNTYTISKNGLKKLIHQTPWRKDGKIAGLVELSIVIPEDAPHYVR